MNYRHITKITAAVAAAGLVVSLQSARANEGNESQQQTQVQNAQAPANLKNTPGANAQLPSGYVPTTAPGATVQAGTVMNEPAGAKASDPAEFVQAACMANKCEIEMGKLAEEKGQSRQVKALGAHLVRDHQAVGEKLKAIAMEKNLQVPSQLDAKHQQKVDALAALSGAAFDRQFVDDQVKGHEKTIALFQQAAASNSDPDLRNFAQSNLPTLQHHLQMAEKDSSIINEPAGAAKNGTYTQ